MIYRGPSFLDSAPRPPLPPLPSANCISFSFFLYVSPVQLTDGRGGGEGAGVEPNHTTARELGTSIILQSSLGIPIYWTENTYVMAVSIMFLSARWWFKSCSSISGCRWVTSFGCDGGVYICTVYI
jgi:hypothetical protein